jgi:radical SAM superfamily enzyme YgiQ (UPF0313 family)
LNPLNIIRVLEEEVLPFVQKPARYIGGEINASVRPRAEARILFSYPDVYELGMSHLGLQILYDIVNRDGRFAAERAFAVWPDMEERMKAKGIPLFSLESRRPAREFDLWGFSLQSELTYTNILAMLSLAGLPLLASRRAHPGYPLVLGGGIGAYNPEPLADFFDLFLIGDGEEAIVEIMEAYQKERQEGSRSSPVAPIGISASLRQERREEGKLELLRRMVNRVPGLYAPALYRPAYDSAGKFTGISPIGDGIPSRIEKRVFADLNRSQIAAPLVPLTEVTHDRSAVEIMRGCARGCRFCAAGWTSRPVRRKSKEETVRQALALAERSGRGEVSLLSLSSGDHPEIAAVMEELSPVLARRRIGLSLPSLNIASVTEAMLLESKRVSKSGITLAPEAASPRLQRAIGKSCDPQRLWDLSQKLKAMGWRLMKLYFMVGLPGETREDVEAIVEMINRLSRWGGETNVTISTFVPKPATPFQWAPMAAREEIRSAQAVLRSGVRSRRVRLKFRSLETSLIEGVISRGDRRVGGILLAAHEEGCRFDEWEEHLSSERWERAFSKAGLAPEFYLRPPYGREDTLPWDHIGGGVDKATLIEEARKAGETVA